MTNELEFYDIATGEAYTREGSTELTTIVVGTASLKAGMAVHFGNVGVRPKQPAPRDLQGKTAHDLTSTDCALYNALSALVDAYNRQVEAGQ